MEVALVILDGWGLGNHNRLNAIAAADTSTFERCKQNGAVGQLRAHGRSVGLPSGQMGNSEVGHLTIGAGRVVKQAYTRINEAIEANTLAEKPAIQEVLEFVKEHDSRLHLLGLASDGGVHADHRHLHALIEIANTHDIDAVTHAFTDGRDTRPKASKEFVQQLQTVIKETGTGNVGTISGRYFAMDRDQNWGRTHRVYEAIVNRNAEHKSADPIEAITSAYERGETDEFIQPTLIDEAPTLEDGDGVLFCNFRADRARQLTRMMADINPEWSYSTHPPQMKFVTMTEYDREFDLPVVFPPNEPTDPIGKVIASNNLSQFRIAESEKYAHVTYFLNGGREIKFPGEMRTIIHSPDVATYDLKPEMSAPKVTDVAIETIRSEDPDVMILNYANPDMIGHTGNYKAAIEAIEAVDDQLNRLVPVIQEYGAHSIITADHGNAEDMGTVDDPHTAHTYNPVPIIYLDPEGKANDKNIRSKGTLSDIAPTLLRLLNIDKPDVMTGQNLLVDKDSKTHSL